MRRITVDRTPGSVSVPGSPIVPVVDKSASGTTGPSAHPQDWGCLEDQQNGSSHPAAYLPSLLAWRRVIDGSPAGCATPANVPLDETCRWVTRTADNPSSCAAARVPSASGHAWVGVSGPRARRGDAVPVASDRAGGATQLALAMQDRRQNEPRLVGRGAERNAIKRAVSGLMAGIGSVLRICGEPGIGKTTLLREVIERAKAGGARVLSATGNPLERDRSFGLVRDAFGDWLGDVDAQACRQFGRHRLYSDIAGLLRWLAIEGPVVLALDDVHWADTASCELVAHLLCRWPRGAVLGVFAHWAAPPVPLRSALAVATSQRHVATLELGPLTSDDADEMLGDAVPPTTRRCLYEMSGGNPFYLRELRETLTTTASVPPRVLQLVDDELLSLSVPARSLIRGAAVAGEPFPVTVAAGIAGIAECDVASALDELQAHGLVRRADALGEGTLLHDRQLVFRRPLLGRAVYESLGEGWRMQAHARAAKILGEQGAPIAIRAHHVERYAAPGDRAAAKLFEQAGYELAMRAPSGAADWFARALSVMPHDVAPDRRVSLLTGLASALAMFGTTIDCRKVLDEALVLAADASPDQRAHCVVTAARVHHVVADRRDMRAILEAELDSCTDVRWQGRLHAQLSIEHWTAFQWRRMRAHAASALTLARRGGDGDQQALAHVLAAHAHKELGALPAAVKSVRSARAIVDRLSDDRLAPLLEVLAYLGQAEHELGQHRDAVLHLERGLAIARERGQDLHVPRLGATLGLALASLGRLKDAAQTADVAVRVAAALEASRPRAVALATRCAVAVTQGQFAQALRAGQQATDAAETTGNRPLAAAVAHRLGEALIESGDHSRGRDTILEGCGGTRLSWVAAQLRPRVYGLLADADLAQGRIGHAENWVRAAEQHAARLALAIGQADARTARAALMLAQQDRRAAAVAIESAATYSTLAQEVDAARARALAGRALALGADRASAVERLRHAHRAFDACGATRMRDRVAAELRGLGERVGRSGRRVRVPAQGVASLSPREREVVELVALGQSNRRIADALFVSAKTVETHLSNIFEKLGVSSRAEVAAHWAKSV
jgi:DNA-binding CsgD family transcriptional regulator/tetratricopeptide (TPR) repeat protein